MELYHLKKYIDDLLHLAVPPIVISQILPNKSELYLDFISMLVSLYKLIALSKFVFLEVY